MFADSTLKVISTFCGEWKQRRLYFTPHLSSWMTVKESNFSSANWELLQVFRSSGKLVGENIWRGFWGSDVRRTKTHLRFLRGFHRSFSSNDPNPSPPPRPPPPQALKHEGETHQDDNVWPEQETNNPRSSTFLGSDFWREDLSPRLNRTSVGWGLHVCEHMRTVLAPKPPF